ncbi:MAG TPA: hypothetical protein VNZ22_00225, partial [Bacillota bacterium]|nr:hypothetical protein [Bacillota bacterium]
MKTRYLSCLAVCVFSFAALAASAADLVLFDFTKPFDSAKILSTDAKVSAINSGSGSALRVTTGHQQPWPGITLAAPAGHWELSAYAQIALKLRNPGTNAVTVTCRVDNPGANGTDRCLSQPLALSPGQTGTLKVTLKRTRDDKLDGKLFGMRGYPVTLGGAGTIDASNITQLLVFVGRPSTDHRFEIQEIRAAGTYTPPTACITDATPFFPLIDTFGQYKHKDWPGKTRSLEDLKRKRQQEAEELARQPGPQDWDKYGGFNSGPQLKAIGFFRTQKVNGKWWLVDPEGHLFFSHGIDCVRMLDATPVEEREAWFEDFPGHQPEFAAFLSQNYALKGHYAGRRNPRCFSFAAANLVRKYGPEARQAYPPIIHQRLRSWGLNTIANWSDNSICRLHLTPYTD